MEYLFLGCLLVMLGAWLCQYLYARWHKSLGLRGSREIDDPSDSLPPTTTYRR